MTPEAQRIAIAEGQVFGRLTVVTRTRQAQRTWCWLCLCECGQQKEVRGPDLKNGHTKSCGCYRRDTTRLTKTSHGNAKRKQHSPEYRSWRGLLTRALNPNNPAFADYGGRGITVCQEWTESFECFLRDTGRKPSPKHSIERIKNEYGYSPANCKWATSLEQARNRRKRRWKKKP